MSASGLSALQLQTRRQRECAFEKGAATLGARDDEAAPRFARRDLAVVPGITDGDVGELAGVIGADAATPRDEALKGPSPHDSP